MTFDAVAAFPGGELGRRIQSYDWAGSPIGRLAAGPIRLQMVVGIMLGSKQPMFTVWGGNFKLLFYDALECAPAGGQFQAAVLTVCWAC